MSTESGETGSGHHDVAAALVGIISECMRARCRQEILHRHRRLAALPGTPDSRGVRWDEVNDSEDPKHANPERLHLYVVFTLAGHGYRINDQYRRPLGYTATCFCGSPILHAPRRIPCEFPTIPWEDCACNGCVLNVEPGSGRPKVYCSDKCKTRMRLAMNRARRRAEGKKTRKVDELADPIAEAVLKYPKSRKR